MKNIIFLTLNLLALSMSIMCHAEIDSPPLSYECLSSDLEVINICQILKEEIKEIMQSKRPEKVIAFTSGIQLPLHLFLMGDLIHLVEEEQQIQLIEVKQTFYVRCVDQEIFFSTNLTEWKSVVEFITGNFSICLDVENAYPLLTIGTELNQRA